MRIFARIQPNAMIIFTHIPKTAGTTLKFILRSNFGIGHVDSRKVNKDIYTAEDLAFAHKVFFKGIDAITGHNLVNPVANMKVKDARLITMLREPLSRCASHYQDDVVRGGYAGSFKEWIKQEEFQNISVKIISGSNDLELAKKLLKEVYFFVGLTEHFMDSVKLLNLLLGNTLDLRYSKEIVASHNEVKKELINDQASLSILKKYNKLDIELYNFAREEIFLPLLDSRSEDLESVKMPVEEGSNRRSKKALRSIRYNKFIYRPLIKLFYTL